MSVRAPSPHGIGLVEEASQLPAVKETIQRPVRELDLDCLFQLPRLVSRQGAAPWNVTVASDEADFALAGEAFVEPDPTQVDMNEMPCG